jgi:hypothetical protein
MRRPTSIKIFGQKYKIRYDHTDESSYGMTDPDRNTIWLRPGMPEDKLIRVLGHEITHAIINETPLSMRKRFDVEEVCDIVGYHVVDTLAANPDIVAYILREIDDEGEANGEPIRL